MNIVRADIGRLVFGVLILVSGGIAIVSAWQGEWSRATFFVVVAVLGRQEFLDSRSGDPS